ncbi:hypothetical protein Hanom_Chr08g00730281 [Helianthus anomalus]
MNMYVYLFIVFISMYKCTLCIILASFLNGYLILSILEENDWLRIYVTSPNLECVSHDQ